MKFEDDGTTVHLIPDAADELRRATAQRDLDRLVEMCEADPTLARCVIEVAFNSTPPESWDGVAAFARTVGTDYRPEAWPQVFRRA